MCISSAVVRVMDSQNLDNRNDNLEANLLLIYIYYY